MTLDLFVKLKYQSSIIILSFHHHHYHHHKHFELGLNNVNYYKDRKCPDSSDEWYLYAYIGN